jgi:RimJ/RimL family protein N-acetyltransferase
MAKGLLLNCDNLVTAWAFKTHNKVPMLVDRSFGVIENGQIVGAALFSSYNTVNAEFSYYGKGTLTLGIVKALAKIALYELHLARLTVIVPKRPSFLLKKLAKFGFRYEGVQRRYYGPADHPRNTGCRFVVFSEDLEKLATGKMKQVA